MALASGTCLAQNGPDVIVVPKCHQECGTDPNCGPITYEQRCVDGNCFQFPRQHCSPRQVCRQVCG